jgi:multidrug efflux pump subunit AcrB
MEKRIVTVSERAMTTTVNDIEHIESQSYNGVSVTRLYFQPNVKVELALSQVTASSTILRVLPPGMFPPAILKYDAASVPILQLGLSSPTLTETDLYDYGQHFVRTQLATVQGASIPLPYGGESPQVVVDINPAKPYAKQLSATEISQALNAQKLIFPVYMHDVAQVRAGAAVQTNIVRTNGSRGALLTILKNGQASTLDIVNQVKTEFINIRAGLPSALHIDRLFDQSLFVRASINGVLREALIAAGLTGLMILLFLGSWRSALIVCISIPLSILTLLIVLSATGETINIMTLGGLALAVGILVDDATVEIENTHRNLGMKKPLVKAVLDGTQQVAVSAFVATLSICIVLYCLCAGSSLEWRG